MNSSYSHNDIFRRGDATATIHGENIGNKVVEI